jgi:hypothetical protein
VTFREAWKELVDAVQRPPTGSCGRHQVLVHRQVGETATPLRHESDAEPGDAVRRLALQIRAGKSDGTRPRRIEVADRPDGRRLAHAVAAHQCHRLPLGHPKVHAEEGLARAVGSFDPRYVEQHQA